jgi:hypothetical protein
VFFILPVLGFIAFFGGIYILGEVAGLIQRIIWNGRWK